jgi:hypothetical protein
MKELKKNRLLHGVRLPSSYKRVQFPCVPAFTITAHKTQGLTMSQLILAATLNKRDMAPTNRYLYVVLSRLRSLQGLTLLQELPLHTHSCYKQAPALKIELERLSRLETVTLQHAAALLHLLPPARVSKPRISTVAPTPSAEQQTSKLKSVYERMSARMAAGDSMAELQHAARSMPTCSSSAVRNNASAFADDSVSQSVFISTGNNQSDQLQVSMHRTNAAAFEPDEPPAAAPACAGSSAPHVATIQSTTPSESDIMCVPGKGDCSFFSIVLSLLCPLVHDAHAFDAMLARLLQHDAACCPVQLPDAARGVIEAEAVLLRAQAASAAVHAREYLARYLAEGRYSSSWLTAAEQARITAGKNTASLQPSALFFVHLVRFLRLLTFYYAELDEHLALLVLDHATPATVQASSDPATSALPAYMKQMRECSKWLGEGDLTSVASVLHTDICVENYMPTPTAGQYDAVYIKPIDGWTSAARAYPRVQIVIRYVNYTTSQREGVLNHYVGVLRSFTSPAQVSEPGEHHTSSVNSPTTAQARSNAAAFASDNDSNNAMDIDSA